MNIDERIEALMQSVEPLAGMHKDTEKHMVALAQQMRHTDRQMQRLGDYVHMVARIVLNHEDRLRDLEGNDGGSGDQPKVG